MSALCQSRHFALRQSSVFAVGTCVSSHAPRTDPDVRLSRIRLPPRVCDGKVGDHFPYAFQRLWHAFPALCPARALLIRIPLGPRPSLHRLRCVRFPCRSCHRWSFRFVRRLRCYYGRVRLLGSVHHRLRLLTFPMRATTGVPLRSNPRSPSFRCDPFARDVALDPGRASAPRIAVPHMLPSSE